MQIIKTIPPLFNPKKLLHLLVDWNASSSKELYYSKILWMYEICFVLIDTYLYIFTCIHLLLLRNEHEYNKSWLHKKPLEKDDCTRVDRTILYQIGASYLYIHVSLFNDFCLISFVMYEYSITY